MGEVDAAGHPDSIKHSKRIAGLDADLGSTRNCDLGRGLAPNGSHVGQPVVQMILVRNQNHDRISPDLLRTPGGQGKSALTLTERSVGKDHLSREVGWFCPFHVGPAIGAVLAMLLICHFPRVARGSQDCGPMEPAGLW